MRRGVKPAKPNAYRSDGPIPKRGGLPEESHVPEASQFGFWITLAVGIPLVLILAFLGSPLSPSGGWRYVAAVVIVALPLALLVRVMISPRRG